MLTDIIGYAAGALLAVCFLPQVIKTFRTKNAGDVSMGMLLLNLASALLYEIYALRLALLPIILMNGLFILLMIAEISLKWRYDRRSRDRTP